MKKLFALVALALFCFAVPNKVEANPIHFEKQSVSHDACIQSTSFEITCYAHVDIPTAVLSEACASVAPKVDAYETPVSFCSALTCTPYQRCHGPTRGINS
jgi:hypothetical protein